MAAARLFAIEEVKNPMAGGRSGGDESEMLAVMVVAW